MKNDNHGDLYEAIFESWTTIKDASRITDRDHSTIRYWADKGRIRSYRLGESNIRLVNIEEVKEYSEHANRLGT